MWSIVQPLPEYFLLRCLMARDASGRGKGARGGSTGGRHGGRTAGGGARPSGAPQQVPVYGAVPPPPSMYSTGDPAPRARPSVRPDVAHASERRAAQPDASQHSRAVPSAAVGPAAGPTAGRPSAKAGLGHQRQPAGLPSGPSADSSRTYIRSSNSRGGGGAAAAANWAGTDASGVFSHGACRVAYESDREPGVWKVKSMTQMSVCTA